MSPNAGGRGGSLSQWVQLYTGAQINIEDLNPYLTYACRLSISLFVTEESTPQIHPSVLTASKTDSFFLLRFKVSVYTCQYRKEIEWHLHIEYLWETWDAVAKASNCSSWDCGAKKVCKISLQNSRKKKTFTPWPFKSKQHSMCCINRNEE
jgi:hypothetical protein